ncbi:MAG: TldD/PmbA family protein [Alphaproteobacteria bacterium]|nr:TldD/PmbA family protein [Alphaproteobacteria bacterium]
MNDAILDLAERVVGKVLELGADEVSVGVSEGSHTDITRRDGKVEQASESSTRRLGLSLLLDDKWSTHSSSDLRPEALDHFLERAVAATRFLEPDAARRLPPADLCGRGASEASLDHFDPAWKAFTPADRATLAQQLEDAVLARRDDDFISATVSASDGWGRHVQVTSHGFADATEGAWYALSAGLTLSDADGRRPEGHASYAARYRTDLPDIGRIADEAVERAQEAKGAGPIASGKYPMLLLNRVAGRILGTLSGPLSGYNLHHGQSCLAGKRGLRIGSDVLTILDDPTIPRGLASTPWDGDLMAAVPRTVVEGGVLQTYYLSTYYARKLEEQPTTGERTNWIVPPGVRSWSEIASAFPRAILVTGFLGGNHNALTGDFSFGIRGRLLEHGVPTTPLSEMNVAGNTLQIFHQLVEAADDPWTYSATVAPTLVFEDVQFSGT